jgi:hypothetical protein
MTQLVGTPKGIDRRVPGLMFRMADEQARLRQHLQVFVDRDPTRTLDTALAGAHEVTIRQARSEG